MDMSMKRQPIDQQLIIERYLQGKLTQSEEEAFEEAYLGNPELVEQLKLTERLRGGLVDLEARGEPPKPAAHRGGAAFLAAPQYAAAATLPLVGALVLSTLLYVENASLRDAPPMTADTRVA